MKNFKKVLALVLVVATLFSFVAMASAKTLEDYSDASEVKFEEAVDVLSALGIVNGYDGAFHPGDNIDRDEMAKMVACLRNAGEFEADLYASANKFADAKGSWAEGYIAYCAQLGIVAGRNASTFDPDGKVTGVEVLKMLLCTLGYDAKEQGYVGANWQVNVVRDAKKSDLLEGLSTMDVYAAATRDQAAQMFLNTLKADMVVGYLSENIVKLSNSLYIDADNSISLPDAEKKGWEVTYCNAIISNVPLYTIFGKNIAVEEGMDCFGRPSYVWTITNKYGASILKKAYAAVPEFVFTEDVKLESELSGLYSYAKENYEYLHAYTYRNGVLETDASYLKGNDVNTIRDKLANASKMTGNGILTEVYFTEDGIYIIIVETFIGKVESVAKRKGTVTLTNGKTFKNVLGLEEDDYVLYHECAGAATSKSQVIPGNHMDAIKCYDRTNTLIGYLHDVELAVPTVEEVIHASRADGKYWLDESYFQTASDKFEYAGNFGKDVIMGEVQPSDLMGIGYVAPEQNLYDVYVNEYGYVMYFEESESKYDYEYGYIVEDSHDADNFGIQAGLTRYDLTFDVVDFDGGYNEDVAAERNIWAYTSNIDAGEYDDGTDDGMDTGVLVRYFVNEDGQAEVDNYNTDIATVARAGAYVTPGVAKIYGTDVFGDRETKYMVRTYNWASQDYTYEVYEGYQNLPETLFGVKTVDGDVAIATLQYLVSNDEDDDQNIATHVFIDCIYSGANELFYLLGKASTDSETALYPYLRGYNVYTALVDGEKAYVAATDVLGNAAEGTGILGLPTASSVNRALYRAHMQVMEGATINGLPIYVALEKVEKVTWSITGIVNNGLISINDVVGYKQIAEDAVINVIYLPYTEDEYFNKNNTEYEYVTFEGEDIEDINDFFAYEEWDEMNIYTVEELVGDEFWTGKEVYEITAMWIELVREA